LRTVVFEGLTHTGIFAVNAVREADPEGRLIIVEPTIEKAEVAKKQFTWAEVLKKNIDEFVQYLKENASLIDVFVSCSDSDAINYKFCNTALESGIPVIIAVLNNPMNRSLFHRSGIRLIVDPFSTIAPQLLEILKPSGEIFLYESYNGHIALAAYKAGEAFKPVKSPLEEVVLMVVKPDGSVKINPEKVSKGEILYVFGRKEAVKNFLERVKS